MISRMREYFRGLKLILLFVVAAFITTSVVYFGSSSQDGRAVDGRVAATVNGEDIPMERFRRAYTNYMEFYRQVYRERLTPEMAERLGVATQVVNDLVNEALIVQQAEREGVRVSDEELRARIQGFRAFQENGRFSRDRYLAVLRQARLDAGEFEAEQRRDIQRRRMEALVKEGAKVSDEEVRQAYAFRREQVRAVWAHLDIRPLEAAMSVSDAEAETYLKSHAAQFTRPERRRVQYVVVSAKPVASSVSDADAEAYYKEHAGEFERARRARAAHVLVRVPPTGGSDAEAQSRAKAEDVIRRAKGGEDFAKLAREISEDQASAPQGGDLGFVGPGEMVPQFEQAVFALKKGELSPAPVRTPFGYHAIKVLDIEEGGRAPFKDVAGKIREKLAAERAEKSARARAEEMRAALQPGGDFGAAARKAGFEPREASMARGEDLPGVGRDTALEEATFGLAVGGVSVPVKVGESIAVIKVLEHLQAGVPPLAAIKEQVVQAAKRERAQAQAAERAKALVSAAGDGDFMARAKQAGFSAGETPFFSRHEPPKEPGALPPAVLVAALQTAAGHLTEPVTTPAGVYLVKTLERRPPDMKDLDTEREDLRRQVLERKRTALWEGWVQSARARAKIDVSPQLAALAR